MSLNSSTVKKRTGGSKKKDYEYDSIGDPVSPEGYRTGGLPRACDVIYYLLAFAIAVVTLILVILLWIHMLSLESEVAIIKDCVQIIKDCADYIKTTLDSFKDAALDCLNYLKMKVGWIHDIVDEQRMVEAPYECDDYNVCTKDFKKQGACMNLPVHCDEPPVIIAKGAKSPKKSAKNILCDPIACHDKCYLDPPPPPTAAPTNSPTAAPPTAAPPMVKKNTLKHQAGLKSGNGPNGECGHGHDLGTCVPSTECKGTCDPMLQVKKDLSERNGGCHPQCPELNFDDVFYYPPICHCSECHQCEYEGVYHLEDQPVYSPSIGPDICHNTQLQEKKCMVALKNEYLKECIKVHPVCDFEPILIRKDDIDSNQKTKTIGAREYPVVDVYLRCLYTFACAEPVIWTTPAPTSTPTPGPTTQAPTLPVR